MVAPESSITNVIMRWGVPNYFLSIVESLLGAPDSIVAIVIRLLGAPDSNIWAQVEALWAHEEGTYQGWRKFELILVVRMFN